MSAKEVRELGGFGLLVGLGAVVGSEWKVAIGGVVFGVICIGLSFALRGQP